uniref:GAE domain-containing protein n=1 Tax=Hemiselmis andersenii TaxID=464988 RepID=A0A7S1HEL5_HEMAN
MATPQAPVAAPTPVGGGGLGLSAAGNPQMLAYDKNGITARMELVKHPSNKTLTQINASFTSSNAVPVTNFTFQAAVPKHAKLQINPPSSTTIPPSNSGTVTQVFRISNPMHDQKILSMRIKLDFALNGNSVSDVVQLDCFPPGV